MQSRKRTFEIVIFTCLLTVLGSFCVHAGQEKIWADYREAFRSRVKICNNQVFELQVTLPEEFLNRHKQEIELKIDVTSLTYFAHEKALGATFKTFTPWIWINKGMMNLYNLPVNNHPPGQSTSILIDKNKLKPGENLFKLSFDCNPYYLACRFDTCFAVKELSFPTAPQVSYLIPFDSDPQGAQLFINGTLKGATPLTVNLKEGTYKIWVQKQGYEKSMANILLPEQKKRKFHFTMTQE